MLYIGIPHGFLLFFMNFWSMILAVVTFWITLFTGKFPQGIFEYQTKLMKWIYRLQASLCNLVDGYPAFGLNGTSDTVTLELERPEKVSRGLVLVRVLFGAFYVALPHGICFSLRLMASSVCQLLAWWAVLFTGKYPERLHSFNVGTLRWGLRLGLYMSYMVDQYPRFSGKE